MKKIMFFTVSLMWVCLFFSLIVLADEIPGSPQNMVTGVGHAKAGGLGIINGDYFGSTIEDGPQIMLWGNKSSSAKTASKDIIIDSHLNEWYFVQGERFDSAISQKEASQGSLRFVSVKNRSQQTVKEFLAEYRLIKEVARSNMGNRISASVINATPQVNTSKLAMSSDDVLYVNTDGVVMSYQDIQSLKSTVKAWREQSPKGEIVIVVIKKYQS
jgi:hypothetical protein